MDKPKVVVIDDDVVTLKMLSTILSAQGFQVETAQDASTGFPLVRSEVPKLVILDVNMPDRDGLSLLWEFRQDPDLKNIPVLILTSEEKFKVAGLAFDLGASGYMTKPFTSKSVQAKVSELLVSEEAPANATEEIDGNVYFY